MNILKFKKKKDKSVKDEEQEKKEMLRYKDLIAKKLENPKEAKKAALIIQEMLGTNK